MTDAAIIAGSLVDVRNVGTHKSVKLTIHVPEEHATKIFAAFGWPTGVNPISVAIARLDPDAEKPRPVSRLPAGADKERRAFGDMPLAQQAGLLCNDAVFHKFLQQKHRAVWMRCDDFNDQRRSANVVRDLCKVDSRAGIKSDNAEWTSLVLAYRLWKNHPELEDA